MVYESKNLYPNCDIKILERLKYHNALKWFANIMSYSGDEELISSCNDEYNIDINECIITNGIVNKVLMRINDGMEVMYSTSVRGASYVIIVSFDNSETPKLDLRIDEKGYINAVDELVRSIERIVRNDGFKDMKYYLTEWRTSEKFIIKNNDTI